jgi:tetratricopeptide (TPR) repeat protein
MRKLPHILLLFLLLSACTSKSQYDAMRRGLDSLNERNRSDQPFTAADVQPYVDFFDSHGTSNDQLLAYYLLGRSYHERGEAPMALKYYQQAIECADTTSSDCDYAQLCRV